tara:strand:- start:406 stop:786 length:381 start_codon:yes stop_codon:yes gene_type:complete
MKRFLATLFVAPLTLSSSAFAGDLYANVEANSYWVDGDGYIGTQTILHVGYRDTKGKFGYYVQGGPLVTVIDGEEEWEQGLSFETGVAYQASKDLKVYGEVGSFIVVDTQPTFEDVHTKVGAEYVF